MSYRYDSVVWDFNGTIFDDVGACFEAANRLMERHGLKPLESLFQYRNLFGFPIRDYYIRMGFDFNKTPYEDLAIEWVKLYNEYSAESKVFTEAVRVAEHLQERGFYQCLLSATEYRMLSRQLDSLGISRLFQNILGSDNIHAYGKEQIACRWRENHPDRRVVLIGDTEHDFEVARSIGADCILFSRGHRNEEDLKKTGAVLVSSDYGEIESLICGFQG